MEQMEYELLCDQLQAKSQTPQQVVCPAPAAATEPQLTYSQQWQVVKPLPAASISISTRAVQTGRHHWTLESAAGR